MPETGSGSDCWCEAHNWIFQILQKHTTPSDFLNSITLFAPPSSLRLRTDELERDNTCLEGKYQPVQASMWLRVATFGKPKGKHVQTPLEKGVLPNERVGVKSRGC